MAHTDPLVVTLATGDTENAPSADQVRFFTRRVAALSDGAIEISPEYHVMEHDPDFERALALAVADGEYDLAVVATRAWDLVGVRSLTALNAPFLVTTDELVAEIVSGDVADDLMSGLPDAGVVGLGLMPEGLRHPFGFNSPLLEATDYADSTMRVPYSATAEAVFEQLGADITAEDVDATTQRGAESSSSAWHPRGSAPEMLARCTRRSTHSWPTPTPGSGRPRRPMGIARSGRGQHQCVGGSHAPHQHRGRSHVLRRGRPDR